MDRERERRILDLVRRIPEGMVSTYGELSPGAPRFAGTVLASCTEPSVPWHRVVRGDGSLAQGERQRRRLDREGVPFRGSRVDLEQALVPGAELAAIEPAGERP